MDTLRISAWLAIQAASILRYLWFVSLPVAALGLVSLVWLYAHRPVTLGARIAICLCGAFPAVMLLFGAIFWVDPAVAHGATAAKVAATYGAFFLFIAGFIYTIAIARGQRLAAMGLAGLGCWLGLWASFVAGMAVTGDWL